MGSKSIGMRASGGWALGGLLLAACSGSDIEPSASSESASVIQSLSSPSSDAVRDAKTQKMPGAVPLSVMTFNIFYGGDDLDLATGGFCPILDGCQETFERVVETIRAAKADIVGVQEPERNTARLAGELGWFADPRNHVISRWPIVDPPGGNGIYTFVEVSPGKVVAVANVHLPSDPYGPYLVRDGASAEELDALERTTRLPAVEEQVAALPVLALHGFPVFLTGDFNSPSHLDWTSAVARVRADVKYPFVWPVSKALADAGLRDSYRQVHPDPVARPGFTWTPGSPEADPQEVFDRIDWVLTAGPTRTVKSQLVRVSIGSAYFDAKQIAATAMPTTSCTLTRGPRSKAVRRSEPRHWRAGQVGPCPRATTSCACSPTTVTSTSRLPGDSRSSKGDTDESTGCHQETRCIRIRFDKRAPRLT